jgi:uncharacterized protein (TIRG00374 family)
LTQSSKDISELLSGKRILIAIAIGLTFSVYMVVSAIFDVTFEKVESGKGEYVHIETSKKFDKTDEKQFKLSENGDYIRHTYRDALNNANWTFYSGLWLFLAILMMVVRDFAYMIRIRVLTDKRLKWKQSFFVIMIWEFASALSPGVVGGAAVAMFILAREKIEMGRATAIVVVTALMDNLFYIVMTPLVFLFISNADLFPSGDEASFISANTETIFWLGFLIIIAVCSILFISIFFYPRLIKIIIITVFKLPFLKRWKKGALQTGNDVVVTSKELRGKPASYWLASFGATVLSWVARYLVINFILMAFVEIGFLDNVLIFGKQLVMWLIMLVSPTPGGSGIAEVIFADLLGNFVASSLLISALAILWRLISYFPYLFIGFILFPRWLRMTAKNK